MDNNNIEKFVKRVRRRQRYTLLGVEEDGTVFEMMMGDDANYFVDQHPDRVIGVYSGAVKKADVVEDMEHMNEALS